MDPFRGIRRIFFDLLTENRKMSTCNSVGFQNTMILIHLCLPSLSVVLFSVILM